MELDSGVSDLAIPSGVFELTSVPLVAGREGGARIEAEHIDNKLIIHNYGAGGTGFQASW